MLCFCGGFVCLFGVVLSSVYFFIFLYILKVIFLYSFLVFIILFNNPPVMLNIVYEKPKKTKKTTKTLKDFYEVFSTDDSPTVF